MAAETPSFSHLSSLLRAINSLVLDGPEIPPAPREHAITVLTSICVALGVGLPHPAGIYLLCDSIANPPESVKQAVTPAELAVLIPTVAGLFEMLSSHTA